MRLRMVTQFALKIWTTKLNPVSLFVPFITESRSVPAKGGKSNVRSIDTQCMQHQMDDTDHFSVNSISFGGGTQSAFISFLLASISASQVAHFSLRTSHSHGRESHAVVHRYFSRRWLWISNAYISKRNNDNNGTTILACVAIHVEYHCWSCRHIQIRVWVPSLTIFWTFSN